MTTGRLGATLEPRAQELQAIAENRQDPPAGHMAIWHKPPAHDMTCRIVQSPEPQSPSTTEK